jgi:hypothetical protein
MLKAKRVGRMPGQQPRGKPMTTIHLPLNSCITPMGATFSRISRALSQYRAAKSQKAYVAKQIELLAALDSHMLSDIGLKGFNQLAIDQKENLLLDAIKQD